MVIDLEKNMHMANPCDSNGAHGVGFAEGVDVIFITINVGLFMTDLKFCAAEEGNEPEIYYSYPSYMGFYAPGKT